MEQNTQITSNPPVSPTPEIFPDSSPLTPCTSNICTNGHRFKPKMVVFDCPECKGPCLVAKMENCPYCNEPVEKMVLRVDIVPKGSGVAKRCRGEDVRGESMEIVLERKNHLEVESR